MRITKERLSTVTFSQPYSPGYNLCIVVREGSNVTEEQYTSGTAVIGIVGSTASADWLISSLGEAAYQNRLTDGSIKLYPHTRRSRRGSEPRRGGLRSAHRDGIPVGFPDVSACTHCQI